MKRLLVPATLVIAIAAAALVFGLAPDVDLRAANLFYGGEGTFVAQTPLGELTRRLVYWVPTLVLVVCAALYIVRRFGFYRGWAPTGRGVLLLALSFAIGPGLLTNVVLKDHSHRPRPYQTVEFGGSQPFRPFYTFDGACKRNCSFVSGEGSAAFWTVLPALLTPPPVQIVAVPAAVLFGLGVGALRMAVGAHFLSDTVFAGLFTWLVGWVLWRALLGERRSGSTAANAGRAGGRRSDQTAT